MAVRAWRLALHRMAVPCLVLLAGLAASSVPLLARSGERGAPRKKASAKAASEPMLHAQRPSARLQGAAGHVTRV